jgi:hypothetical protein
MTQEDPALKRARKHVSDVRNFYYHLMTYVLANALMIAIDRGTGPNDGFLGLDWAFWIIVGWGFGIAGHAISVFFGEFRVRKLYEQEKSRDLESR